jgi:hypothetical protein
MDKIGLSKNYNRIEPGQRINVSFSGKSEDSREKEDEYSSGALIVYDSRHSLQGRFPRSRTIFRAIMK